MVIVMAASRDKQLDRWIAEIKALEVKLDEIEERVVCFFFAMMRWIYKFY